jgi:hypothetical protein
MVLRASSGFTVAYLHVGMALPHRDLRGENLYPVECFVVPAPLGDRLMCFRSRAR